MTLAAFLKIRRNVQQRCKRSAMFFFIFSTVHCATGGELIYCWLLAFYGIY